MSDPNNQRADRHVHDVAIIGAGFSGIGMGIKLDEAGIGDFVILERGDDIGGTWRDNDYPGCACDIPSHLYSYSFEQNAAWTRLYPPQAEIQGYLRSCARKRDIMRRVELGADVTRAAFDDRRRTWVVSTADGRTVTARALVSAIGGLSRPVVPDLPGLHRFRGEAFHSARWDHGYDLRGKRVAVVGTGASAVQFVPQIAPLAGHVALFQRSAPWIVPKPDRPMRAWELRLFRRLPLTRWLFRSFLYWRQEVRGVGFTVSPRLMRLARRMAFDHLTGSVADPDLRAKLTPDYAIGCKRILLSDDYYPAVQRDNVTLVTDSIAEVTEDAVIDRTGRRHEVDAIIFGTGFNATDPLTPTRIFGSGGRELATDWEGGPEAFLGVSVAGYPNLFLLMGPNTGLGHNSMIFMIEAQIRYAVSLLAHALSHGAADVRADVQAAYNQALQRAFEGTVWTSGCNSWYQAESGRQAVLWPGFTFSYWFRTLRPKLDRYKFVSR